MTDEKLLCDIVDVENSISKDEKWGIQNFQYSPIFYFIDSVTIF